MAKLQAKKLSTYGAFAFLSSFQPGSSDERPFVRALASALDVAEADLNDAVLSSFRRLYYECHTMTLGDLRARIERKDDDACSEKGSNGRAFRTLSTAACRAQWSNN